MSDEVVWTLPVLAQEFVEGPRATLGHGRLVLEYDYESESGEYLWSRVEFKGVRGVIYTAVESCQEEHVAAYGKLVVVGESSWLRTLKRGHFTATDNAALRHYRIFFDDVGCYDIASTSFDAEPLAARPMTPPKNV